MTFQQQQQQQQQQEELPMPAFVGSNSLSLTPTPVISGSSGGCTSVPATGGSAVVEITIVIKEDNLGNNDGTHTTTTIERKYELRLTLPLASPSARIQSMKVKLHHPTTPPAFAAPHPVASSTTQRGCSYPVTPPLRAAPPQAQSSDLFECYRQLKLREWQRRQLQLVRAHLLRHHRYSQHKTLRAPLQARALALRGATMAPELIASSPWDRHGSIHRTSGVFQRPCGRPRRLAPKAPKAEQRVREPRRGVRRE